MLCLLGEVSDRNQATSYNSLNVDRYYIRIDKNVLWRKSEFHAYSNVKNKRVVLNKHVGRKI